VEIIADAGRYTAPSGAGPNDWIEHFANDSLSVGTYSIPAGGLDDQKPHTEDEIYVVQAGHATLVCDSGNAVVGPGAVVFVPAGEAHQFTDVTSDLAVLVLFAPPYGSKT